MRAVCQGVQKYTLDGRYFPASYVYPDSETGTTWKLEDQQNEHPNPQFGYLHWSYARFSGDQGVAEDAFTCPTMPRRGAVRAGGVLLPTLRAACPPAPSA